MASAPALGSHAHGLFLAWLCSCCCFQGTGATFHAFINSSLQISASFGQSFPVPCEGHTAFRSSSIYWLANGSFVEYLYLDGAVTEEEPRRKGTGTGHYILQRKLVFHSFSEQDLHTTFKCVILDPAGPALKILTWLPPNEEGSKSGGSGSGTLGDP